MTKKIYKMYSDFIEQKELHPDIVLTYTVGDESFDIHVKTSLSTEDVSTFVERVAEKCFDNDGEYRPEFMEPIFQITILQMLTDVEPFSFILEEKDENGKMTGNRLTMIDIEKTYEFCRCLDLYNYSNNETFRNLYQHLMNLVCLRIEFIKQKLIAGEKKKLNKAMVDIENGIALINSVSEKLVDVLGENVKQTNAIYASAELGKRFENISDEQLIEHMLEK